MLRDDLLKALPGGGGSVMMRGGIHFSDKTDSEVLHENVKERLFFRSTISSCIRFVFVFLFLVPCLVLILWYCSCSVSVHRL